MTGWVKSWREEKGTFARLPYIARAIFRELMVIADDEGVIEHGDRDPVDHIAWVQGADASDRRMLRKHLPALIADGCLVAEDGRLRFPNWELFQGSTNGREVRTNRKRTQNESATNHARTDNEPTTNSERTQNEPETRVELSTRKEPILSARIEEKRINTHTGARARTRDVDKLGPWPDPLGEVESIWSPAELAQRAYAAVLTKRGFPASRRADFRAQTDYETVGTWACEVAVERARVTGQAPEDVVVALLGETLHRLVDDHEADAKHTLLTPGVWRSRRVAYGAAVVKGAA